MAAAWAVRAMAAASAVRARAAASASASHTKIQSRFISSQKESRLEEAKGFIKKEWDKMDSKSKFTMMEMIARSILFGLSGGWGLMLAKSVLDRVDKTDEAVKKMNLAMDDTKQELAESDERYRKYKEEVDTKYQKLQNEVNELKALKDLWIAEALKISKVPVPGTEEGKGP